MKKTLILTALVVFAAGIALAATHSFTHSSTTDIAETAN